jgi:hypothetical protein
MKIYLLITAKFNFLKLCSLIYIPEPSLKMKVQNN